MRLIVFALLSLASVVSSAEYNLVASSPYRMLVATTGHLSLDSLELLQHATLEALVNAQDTTLYQTEKTKVIFQAVHQDRDATETVVRFFCVTSSAITVQPVTYWDSLVNHILVSTMQPDTLLSSDERLASSIKSVSFSAISPVVDNTAGASSPSGAPLTAIDITLILLVAVGFIALTTYFIILCIRDRKEAREVKQGSVINTVDTIGHDDRDVRIHVVEAGLQRHVGSEEDDDDASDCSVQTSLSDVVKMVQSVLRKEDYRKTIILPLPDDDPRPMPDDESIPFDESRNGDDSLFQFDGSVQSDSFALVTSSGHSTVCDNSSKV